MNKSTFRMDTWPYPYTYFLMIFDISLHILQCPCKRKQELVSQIERSIWQIEPSICESSICATDVLFVKFAFSCILQIVHVSQIVCRTSTLTYIRCITNSTLSLFIRNENRSSRFSPLTSYFLSIDSLQQMKKNKSASINLFCIEFIQTTLC